MYFDYHERLNDESQVVGDASVIIPISEIVSGMYKDIDLGLYLTIIASMNRDGESYIKQETLAEKMGVSIPTIHKRVKKMLTTEVNGYPLLMMEQIYRGKYRRASRYTLPTTNFNISSATEVVVETIEPVEAYSPKMVLTYWRTKFEAEFGRPYQVSWTKDAPIIEKKLMAEYDKETIFEVMDYVIQNYVTRWGSKSYPKPTLGMLTTWLFGEALTRIEQSKPSVPVLTEQEVVETQDKQDELARRFF